MLLAILVSNASLAPLERISAQLDRISRGEFDQAPLERRDEFGQVSTKISAIGQQLRGVREIFSTLAREPRSGSGRARGRAAVVHARRPRGDGQSFGAEFPGSFRPTGFWDAVASEIFPAGHPLRSALGLTGDEFAPVAAAEVDLAGAAPGLPPRRFGVSVQVITEGGTRMGALVTLRDLDSLERISRQLQVSERLAALGRVTAGVAHEVKNPLNSMRLWLENLKEMSPRGRGIAAPGRGRAGQRNRPARFGGEALPGLHAHAGNAPRGDAARGAVARSRGGGAAANGTRRRATGDVLCRSAAAATWIAPCSSRRC